MPAVKGSIPYNKKYVDIELMKKMYYEDKRDFRYIADYFGLKSKTGIYDRFKKLGLEARNNTDLKTGFKHSEETKLKISKSGTGKKHSEESKKKRSLKLKGKKNPMFVDGLTCHAKYFFIWIDDKRVREHRYQWEKHYKTKIPKGYHIHHIDGNSLNNKISNLKCLSASEHTTLHNKERKKIL